MATSFPTALDSLPNPQADTPMNSGTPGLEHDDQHTNANDAIEALQAKVGIDGSAVPSSIDYLLANFVDVVREWTKAQRGQVTPLTSSSGSIAINLEDSNNFSHTLTEDTTLAAPSNPVAGQSGFITITQHASSAKTLAFNDFWRTPNGTPLAVSAVTGSVNTFTYCVNSTSMATCAMGVDVKIQT